ncbi:MAG TPA: hypothetical protein V6C71_19090 [Coleofasciculaceae cyanobacterium]|jgi:hypothetical protein
MASKEDYSLIEAMLRRRSRRFGKGMKLGGALDYQSQYQPQSLSLSQEALLGFAASGVTGYALAELPYTTAAKSLMGSGGNIMVNFIGRTVASADAIHGVVVFVTNDEGTWMLKRPQDYPRTDIPSLIDMSQKQQFVELYERSRVKIADRRIDLPRRLPYLMPFNTWAANVPGTTYFLAVNELSGLYINIMLAMFGEDVGFFMVDERNGYRPAGVEKFGKSKGGHLEDDLTKESFMYISAAETLLAEFIAWEQGSIHQNLGLMTSMLGLGGYPHFAAHPYIWFESLGFRMNKIPFTKLNGMKLLTRTIAQWMGKDTLVPNAVGLEKDGEVLLKNYAPPYYRNMEEAVLAFIDHKYNAKQGTFRDGGEVTGWQDGRAIQAAIPQYSQQAIAATIACCEYIYNRYRFPATTGAFRTLLAYQAHQLDPDFYQRYYRPEAVNLS